MPHEHDCSRQDCCYCHCYHHFHHAPVSSRSHLVRRQSSLRRQAQWGPPASTDDKPVSQDTATKPIKGASRSLHTLDATRQGDFHKGKERHETGSAVGDFLRDGDGPKGLGVVAAKESGSPHSLVPYFQTTHCRVGQRDHACE
jgi:hypothetical protein